MTDPKEKSKTHVKPGCQRNHIGATGKMLRELLPTCSVCQGSTEGHTFAKIASAIVSNKKSTLADLFGSVRRREWAELLRFQDSDIESDNLVVYVIRGDHPDGLVIVVEEPFELYAKNDVFLLEHLTASDLTDIGNMAHREWQQM